MVTECCFVCLVSTEAYIHCIISRVYFQVFCNSCVLSLIFDVGRTTGPDKSNFWESLWENPGVILVVSICVLVTIFVWLLLCFCSRNRSDQSESEKPGQLVKI